MFSLPCCLGLPSVILFVRVKCLCAFLSPAFSFIHSFPYLVCVCACVHTWLRIFWLSNRCTMTALEEGRWFGPVSHACLLYPPAQSIPLLSFVFFFCWSIYHKLCKLSRWGDRRPVQAFLWNRQASREAHCCSGHVCWSTALQRLHIPSLFSLLVRSSPSSMCLKIAFSLSLALMESWCARRISLTAMEKFPQCWFGLENLAGSPSAAPADCSDFPPTQELFISFL